MSGDALQFVHTADTDKTRQSYLVRVGSVNKLLVLQRSSKRSRSNSTYSSRSRIISCCRYGTSRLSSLSSSLSLGKLLIQTSETGTCYVQVSDNEPRHQLWHAYCVVQSLQQPPI